MSTRRLIVTALVTGLVIVVAGTIFLLRLPNPQDVPPTLPTTTTVRTTATTVAGG